MRFSKTSVASRTLQLILIFITAVYCQRTAIAQETKLNEEIVAFTGGSIHPHARSVGRIECVNALQLRSL